MNIKQRKIKLWSCHNMLRVIWELLTGCIKDTAWVKFISIHYWGYAAWKLSKYGVISGPYFPLFGLNTEIYEVNFRIQSEYRKIQTRNNSVFGHFSRSDILTHSRLMFHFYVFKEYRSRKLTWNGLLFPFYRRFQG